MLLELKMYGQHIVKALTFNFLYQHKFNKEWDKALNSYLDEVEDGKLKATLSYHGTNSYTLELTKEGFYKDVWACNKYYSYGYLYSVSPTVSGRILESQQYHPSIHTMIRLEKLVTRLDREYKEAKKLTTEQLYK